MSKHRIYSHPYTIFFLICYSLFPTRYSTLFSYILFLFLFLLFCLGGKDYFGGPLTRFDIPLLWPSIPFFPEYRWHGLNLPGVTLAKGG